MPTTLNAKQLAFCREYIVDFNGAGAARRAGYAHKNAGVTASVLLKKPNIQDQIKVLQEKKAERTDLTADWVIGKLKEIAETDNLGARVRALELLGKHLGIFEADNRQSQNLQVEIVNFNLKDCAKVGQ